MFALVLNVLVSCGHRGAALPSTPTVREVQVGWGDTLWSIATRYGVEGGYPALARLNGIRNPDHIEFGQRLRVPTLDDSLPPWPTATPVSAPLQACRAELLPPARAGAVAGAATAVLDVGGGLQVAASRTADRAQLAGVLGTSPRIGGRVVGHGPGLAPGRRSRGPRRVPRAARHRRRVRSGGRLAHRGERPRHVPLVGGRHRLPRAGPRHGVRGGQLWPGLLRLRCRRALRPAGDRVGDRPRARPAQRRLEPARPADDAAGRGMEPRRVDRAALPAAVRELRPGASRGRRAHRGGRAPRPRGEHHPRAEPGASRRGAPGAGGAPGGSRLG